MFSIKYTDEFKAWRFGLKLGDVKPAGDGVFEMREPFGPGWRMYYVKRGPVLIVMPGGGDKSSQSVDIAEHLDSEQAMAEYPTVVLEENDPAALAGALGSIAQARGQDLMQVTTAGKFGHSIEGLP